MKAVIASVYLTKGKFTASAQPKHKNLEMIEVPSCHHARKARIVHGVDLAANHTMKNSWFADINGRESLKCSVVISNEAVDPQKPNYTEISKNFQDIAASLLFISFCGRKVSFSSSFIVQNLEDVRSFNESLKVV